MGVKKLKSRTMLYSRLLADQTEDLRRASRETVRNARSTIHQSKYIVEQTQEALKNAN
jgi:hypothetical protein